MMNEEVADFLSHLALPEKYSARPAFQLGKSFGQDELIRRSADIIFGKFSKKRDPDPGKAYIRRVIRKGKDVCASMSPFERFNFFVLLFNNYFNAHSNTFFSDSAVMIKIIAKALDIDRKDYDHVLDFYINNVPFFDKNDSVFIASREGNRLIKSKGVNVHFISQGNDVVYLKYFKKFDVFLSKTFSYWRPIASIEELTEVKEINLVTKDNYADSGIAFKSFADLKKALSDFEPFQYIEVDQTEFAPKIILDPDSSAIRMSGNSRPISTTAYFEPVFEWLENYGRHGKKHLSVYFQFHHINTYTMRFLLKMMRVLNHYLGDNKDISIVWVYDAEDDDAVEFGEQLRSLFGNKSKFLLKVKRENVKL